MDGLGHLDEPDVRGRSRDEAADLQSRSPGMVDRYDVRDGVDPFGAVAELEDECLTIQASRDEDVGVVPGAGTRAERLTVDNKRMVLFIAFNYGGRQEIVAAVRRALAEGVEPAALAGFVPCADTGIRQMFRCPCPRAR